MSDSTAEILYGGAPTGREGKATEPPARGGERLNDAAVLFDAPPGNVSPVDAAEDPREALHRALEPNGRRSTADVLYDASQGEQGADPGAYQPFTMPEGLTLNVEGLESFRGTARELGLDQAAAQKLVDLHARGLQHDAEAREGAWRKTVTTWADEVRALPEFAGEQYAEGVRVAHRGLAYAAGPDLPAVKRLLNETGLGSHPLVVKLFRRVGRGMAGEE